MMKRFLSIILLASLPITHAVAQWDTAGLRLQSLSPAPALAGVAMIGAGSLLTFNPVLHEVAVSIREGVTSANLPKLHFDDYIQYIPASAPLALNLCGLKSRHSLPRMALLEGGSYLLGAGWLWTGKYGLGVLRPDNTTHRSFPSGHTFFSFTGAEILRREYGEEYPWIAVAGYTVATIVGLMRIYNNRHWAGDVLAGAGLGILSVTLVYWALD